MPDLNRLAALSLDRTKITDAGLQHLLNLNRLDTLSLDNTGVTVAGVRSLRARSQTMVYSNRP